MRLESNELVERFLAREITARDFKHDMHVAVAWSLLRRLPFADALAQCASTIKFMAEREGAPEKFNTTITVAYMGLIGEHMSAHPKATWDEFISANRQLLDKSLLGRWYPRERLHSPLARETFLLPGLRA